MLLTYCRNDDGAERLYLLPRGSLDAWLEPTPDGGWSYHAAPAEGDVFADFKTTKGEPTQRHLIAMLAAAVGVAPAQLPSIPFQRLALLAAPIPTPTRSRLPRSRERRQSRGWVIATPSFL